MLAQAHQRKGDAAAVLARDAGVGGVRLRGVVRSPAQKHFYMEMQSALATPVPNEHGDGDGVELCVPTCVHALAPAVVGGGCRLDPRYG